MADSTIKVTTTGDAGSATGEAQMAVDLHNALVLAVDVDYHASAPATTNVVVSEAEGLQQTILTLAGTNTDGTYYPVAPLHGADGVAIDNQHQLLLVEGPIKVAVSGCDALTNAVVVMVRTLE